MPRDEQEGERRGQERHQGHQVKGVDVAYHAGLALERGAVDTIADDAIAAAVSSDLVLLSGPVFAIQVESGDLINVPHGTQHWFDLCEDKSIRCIRLFQDQTGWTPHYVEGSIHERYSPVCMGPAYIKTVEFPPVVKV